MAEERTMKYSRQREAILAFLRNRKDHPTAEVIYENIRQEYPKISLGTVYRNLALLSEKGIIMKLSCDDGFEHYDGNIDRHYHFVCKRCGAVMDLDMEDISFINTLAEKKFGGQIDGHYAYFYGICGGCVQGE